MDRKTFKAIIDGEEKSFEVLYTFNSLKTKKDYIIYTDNQYGEDNMLNIYSSIYYPFEDKCLENIENDEDWAEVEEFLKGVEC
jgi:uncharacterized protein YrzB (UPF0473 family)